MLRARWFVFLVKLSAVLGLLVKSIDANPGRPTGLAVVDLEPSSTHGVAVTLVWRDPSGGNASLRYYVRYAPFEGRTTQKVVLSNQAVLKLKPNTWYLVRVLALDADSRQSPWSEGLRVFTNESVPSMAPMNVTARSHDSRSIRVSWHPIPSEYHHALLQGYIVFYRPSNTGRWLRQSVSNDTLVYNIKGLKPGVRYLVAVAGYTNKGAGKKSRPVTVTVQEEWVIKSTVGVTHKTTGETTSTHPTTDMVPKASMYIRSSSPVVTHTPNVTPSPLTNADFTAVQAAKHDMPRHKSSTLSLVFKIILPAAAGGLVLVLLIVCLLWRHRRKAQRDYKQGQEGTMGLVALSDKKSQEVTRPKGVVTRGEGSIRYAPPSCSSPPPSRGTVGEGERPSSSNDDTYTSDETSPMLPQVPDVQTLPVNNVRYVNHEPVTRPHPASDPSRIYAVPFAIPNVPRDVPKDNGYENMKHLYESLEPKEHTKRVYMNLDDTERPLEGLYAEIPANVLEGGGGSMEAPLCPKA
ncbi:neuronal cell adhesion molecule isoform X2 [Nematostella vectensis]|uniref:neuronal cell adhesion molecule isoform X2 n=1 Tax=Nematostella vectensis TaxID=45351 RepID=UPI00139011DD|nr:neuronal cell adhesion molecule isoform X2 [Nematostella vectensis]